jgi:hypothetical protein
VSRRSYAGCIQSASCLPLQFLTIAEDTGMIVSDRPMGAGRGMQANPEFG